MFSMLELSTFFTVKDWDWYGYFHPEHEKLAQKIAYKLHIKWILSELFFRPEPVKEPLHIGLLKVALTICVGLYVGAKFSMRMVAFLEEYNIFVHEEDDDD